MMWEPFFCAVTFKLVPHAHECHSVRMELCGEGVSHFQNQTAAPVLFPDCFKLTCESIKIPQLTSFPETPVKTQAAIHPKYQFYSSVSIIYLPAFLFQYVPVNKISN